eukprot:TRINITY_DN6988_c0_g1_i15.p1 TRINITY_DN6988_c0_g1~~TRINITY_DN6988_c0_g1_i15.p1  ORF type:complete len:181 (+),score=30.16 TRINITY_DN6988_c0_g1_i15:213-755(+)
MGNAPTELLPDWMRNDNESEGSSSDKALDHCVPTFPLNERISQLWRVYDTEQTGWLALIPARRLLSDLVLELKRTGQIGQHVAVGDCVDKLEQHFQLTAQNPLRLDQLLEKVPSPSQKASELDWPQIFGELPCQIESLAYPAMHQLPVRIRSTHCKNQSWLLPPLLPWQSEHALPENPFG